MKWTGFLRIRYAACSRCRPRYWLLFSLQATDHCPSKECTSLLASPRTESAPAQTLSVDLRISSFASGYHRGLPRDSLGHQVSTNLISRWSYSFVVIRCLLEHISGSHFISDMFLFIAHTVPLPRFVQLVAYPLDLASWLIGIVACVVLPHLVLMVYLDDWVL